MSVREIKDKPIFEHEAEAILFVHPNDFTLNEMGGIERRYPGARQMALKLLGNPKFEPGKVLVREYGEKKEKVLFLCVVNDDGDPGYQELKNALVRVAKLKKDTGVRHLAVGYPATGMGTKRVHENAVEDILRVAAEQDPNFMFDFHSTHE